MDSLTDSLKEILICGDASASGCSQSREYMATSAVELRKPLDINSKNTPEFHVLADPLLFGKITQHLNQSELKALSGTGKLLQGLTRNCPAMLTRQPQLNNLSGNPVSRNLSP